MDRLQCLIWGEHECGVNPAAMMRDCPHMCGLCTLACEDKFNDCPNWALGKANLFGQKSGKGCEDDQARNTNRLAFHLARIGASPKCTAECPHPLMVCAVSSACTLFGHSLSCTSTARTRAASVRACTCSRQRLMLRHSRSRQSRRSQENRSTASAF